jgi:uncharacterized protein (TIGR02246 family)
LTGAAQDAFMGSMNADGDLAHRIARLETAEEVRALVAAYADVCDANDLEGIRTIMAPDVVLSVPGQQWSGTDEVLEFYRASWAANSNPSRHFMTNVAMAVLEPDRAEATSSFLYLSTIDGRSTIGWGAYRDTFTRRDGVLVFQSKHFDMDVMTNIEEGWAEALTQLAAARAS